MSLPTQYPTMTSTLRSCSAIPMTYARTVMYVWSTFTQLKSEERFRSFYLKQFGKMYRPINIPGNPFVFHIRVFLQVYEEYIPVFAFLFA